MPQHVTFETLVAALRDAGQRPPAFAWCFSIPAQSVEGLAYWLRWGSPLPWCIPARARVLMRIAVSGSDLMDGFMWHRLFVVGRSIYRTNEPTAAMVADALEDWINLRGTTS